MYNYTNYPGGFGNWQGGVQPSLPVQQPAGDPIWVQGEAGAKAYLVAPGRTVFLFDSERLTFYVKSTNASGMPQPLKIYDYSERKEQPEQTEQKAIVPDMSQYVTKDELKAYLDELTHRDQREGGKLNE